MEWKDVITFWFEESSPRQWFGKDDAFDEEIRSRFLDTHHRVVNRETKHWRNTPEGRLAEILVLDQFSRNMFRDTPEAFEHDAMALALAQEALAAGDDKKLDAKKRYFLYMPYMHSESRKVHSEALWLFLRLSLKDWWSWIVHEYKHKRIIDRFGRYPHRNSILGRMSTPEELEFIKKHPGF